MSIDCLFVNRAFEGFDIGKVRDISLILSIQQYQFPISKTIAVDSEINRDISFFSFVLLDPLKRGF